MASAAPLLGQMFVGQMISKIGKDQGWNPMVTAGLGILGGAGVGSAISGGMAASAAQSAGSFAGSTALSVNPHAGLAANAFTPIPRVNFPSGMSATPHRGLDVLNSAAGVRPINNYNHQFSDGPIGMDKFARKTPLPKIGRSSNHGILFPEVSDAPTYMDKGQQWRSLALDGTKDAWTNLWADEEFAVSMGSTFIDGMFAEQPRKQPIGGGGGGGGGGSAPAYQGGGGGQYQVVGGFPGRATGPQWKEIA